MSKTRTIREQCEYVAKFMADAWDSGLLDPPHVKWGNGNVGKPEKPPTALELEKGFLSGTFPGLKLLQLDDWEWKAGLWFDLKKYAEEKKKEVATP